MRKRAAQGQGVRRAVEGIVRVPEQDVRREHEAQEDRPEHEQEVHAVHTSPAASSAKNFKRSTTKQGHDLQVYEKRKLKQELVVQITQNSLKIPPTIQEDR